jgi:hypothetical protein
MLLKNLIESFDFSKNEVKPLLHSDMAVVPGHLDETDVRASVFKRES